MLSPQRAVAAASGGAGEEPHFPRAHSMATPAALPALVRSRAPARAAVPPRPGAGAARPPLGSLSPRIRGRERLAGPGLSDAGGSFIGPRLGATAGVGSGPPLGSGRQLFPGLWLRGWRPRDPVVPGGWCLEAAVAPAPPCAVPGAPGLLPAPRPGACHVRGPGTWVPVALALGTDRGSGNADP